MQELKVQHLHKTYGAKILLDDVEFIIHEKDRIGLIGTNGTGKSTLLKILAGLDTSEKNGQVEHSSDYKIGLLPQTDSLPNDATVLEAVLTGDSPKIKLLRQYESLLLALEENPTDADLQKQFLQIQEEMNAKDVWQLETKVKGILTQLSVPQGSRKIGELSGGQKKRVALAQVLVEDYDLLLLDEPTNHLDIKAITWLENFLQNYRGALLMVTHDRYFLDRVTQRIFELNQGKLLEIAGNYESYVLQKEVLDETNQLQAEKAQQLYKKELDWMRAGVQGRGTKQEARVKRFENLKESLNTSSKDGQVTMDMGSTRLGKKVLRLKDASLKVQDHLILDDFNLLIQAGDRVGIVGDNGVGKTTLLNLLAGKIPLTSGVFEQGETVRLAYYTQIMPDLPEDLRMIAYLQETAEVVENKNGEKISVPELLERFLFPRFMHGTLVRQLSGGEKRRLFLLKLLMSSPNVLLLDEPTNDLDIATLTVLEDYLQDFKGAVIVVSHDRYFLDKTCHKLILMQGSGKYETYFGTISEYLAQEKIAEKKSVKKEVVKIAAPEPKKSTEKTKLTYLEEKEWATIESEIDQLEQKSSQLEKDMTQQGSDFTALQNLQDELSATQQQLDEKMERWDYLGQFV